MVKTEVAGISLDAETRSPIVLLRQCGTETILPIWIGAMEALSISFALRKIPMPRPHTHDLLVTLLEKLRGVLSCARIAHIRRETFMAELDIRTETGECFSLDCRPSDAIAVALRAGAPIFVSKEVLRQAGRTATPDQLRQGEQMAPGELALLFSSPRERHGAGSGPSAATPDDIFAEIRAMRLASKREKLQKPPPDEPKTWQTSSSVDLTDEETLEKLLLALSPQTKYKM